MFPKPCKHLSDYKQKHGLNCYNHIQKFLKTSPNGRTSFERHESNIPRCGFCSGYQGNLYSCLLCSSISCSNHSNFHTQFQVDHEIGIDLERAELYCFVCNDQVYDPDFDKIVMSKHCLNEFPTNGARVLGKRRKMGSWVELEFDSNVSKRFVLAKDRRRSKSCFPLGLRGLNNLGSTCFMNSVLQALIHTPPFRNYFLSDRHSRDVCRRRLSDRLCLPCDIDGIFSAVFSGDRTPYSPAQFLYSWWQHSEDLACYEQQDAHEFFISMLDKIHEKEGKPTQPNKENEDCSCIAHRVFSGLLRSDVTCTTCGFTSTTYDPCIDISLDMDTPTSSSTDDVSTKPLQSTLSGCLDLFTRPEKLGPDEKLYCQNCQEPRDSIKQMSIKKLPLVLCLHIKRFEHSLTKKTSRKIDRFLKFPFSLDTKPYLSSSIVRTRFGNRIFGFVDGNESSEFEVFAVVTHSGMLESGHYVTYLRIKNQWYKCDDAWITEVDESVVRSLQCYMIYYVQKTLYHKDTLNCTPISMAKDPSGSIVGCC